MANVTAVSTTTVVNESGVKVQTSIGFAVVKESSDFFLFVIVKTVRENGVFHSEEVLSRGYDATRAKAMSKAKAKIKALQTENN